MGVRELGTLRVDDVGDSTSVTATLSVDAQDAVSYLVGIRRELKIMNMHLAALTDLVVHPESQDNE